MRKCEKEYWENTVSQCLNLWHLVADIYWSSLLLQLASSWCLVWRRIWVASWALYTSWWWDSGSLLTRLSQQHHDLGVGTLSLSCQLGIQVRSHAQPPLTHEGEGPPVIGARTWRHPPAISVPWCGRGWDGWERLLAASQMTSAHTRVGEGPH